jgi:quercetin dioxygenase-like cupin family protein
MPQEPDQHAPRFESESEAIDLNQLGSELLAHARDSKRGHAQKTLCKHDGFTAALFAFNAGGSLPEHQANGSVTIHVLAGTLIVGTPEKQHPLTANHLLRLQPGVRHSVEAQSDSIMLLHVSLAT